MAITKGLEPYRNQHTGHEAPPTGFEPATFGLTSRCSNQLSYESIDGDGWVAGAWASRHQGTFRISASSISPDLPETVDRFRTGQVELAVPTGFEPATFRLTTECATRLRHDTKMG